MSLVAFWNPGTVEKIRKNTEVRRKKELVVIRIWNDSISA